MFDGQKSVGISFGRDQVIAFIALKTLSMLI